MNSKQVIAIGACPLPAYSGGSATTNAERGRHDIRNSKATHPAHLECREGLQQFLQGGHRESIRVSETPGSADCLARAAERASSAACSGSATEGLNGSRCSPAAHELIAVCRSISARMALISNKIRVNASGAGSQLHGSSIARSDSMNATWAMPLPQFGQVVVSAMGGLLGLAGGLGQLGPDTLKTLWKQVDARDLLFGVALNQHSQFSRRRTKPIGHVLQVAHAGFALGGEGFSLCWRKPEEVGFEFHTCITPQGVIACQHLLVIFVR